MRKNVLVILLTCFIGVTAFMLFKPDRSKHLKSGSVPMDVVTKGGDDGQIPEFPWPPPRASAFVNLDNNLLVGKAASLQDVAKRIESAFKQTGYGESSYYAVPNGFALVSRIEQINLDGTPKNVPDRWRVEMREKTNKMSIQSFISVLFAAPKGRYRVIVFIATDMAFSQSRVMPTKAESEDWLRGGSVVLPESIGKKVYGANYHTTAFIYEFERGADRDAEAVLKPSSELTGGQHLEKAGLIAALSNG